MKLCLQRFFDQGFLGSGAGATLGCSSRPSFSVQILCSLASTAFFVFHCFFCLLNRSAAIAFLDADAAAAQVSPCFDCRS
jgi:hypothetical protein